MFTNIYFLYSFLMTATTVSATEMNIVKFIIENLSEFCFYMLANYKFDVHVDVT